MIIVSGLAIICQPFQNYYEVLSRLLLTMLSLAILVSAIVRSAKLSDT